MKKEIKKVAALIKGNYLVKVKNAKAKTFDEKYRVTRILRNKHGVYCGEEEVIVDSEGNLK